jgi:hypothetical protein
VKRETRGEIALAVIDVSEWWANDEEGRQNIFHAQVIEKFLSPAAQAIIKDDTLTPQSNFFGHVVISMPQVVQPHVHQPCSLASAAAAGSPAHVPSVVGIHEGMSKPLSSCIHVWTLSEVVLGTLSCAGQSALLNTNLAGSTGAPGIGGVAPGAYVTVTGEGVPKDMPEDIKLSGRTPLTPVGTGVGCDDLDPIIPVPEPADIDKVTNATMH